MKSTVNLLLTIAYLSAGLLSHAQDIKAASYQAYISSDLSKWQSVVKAYSNPDAKSNAAESFELALAQYGLIAHSMFTNNEEIFDQFVPITQQLLDELIDDDESSAEPYAVSSFITGFLIAKSPMKGVYLGPRSMISMNKALELDSQSPVVMQLYAGSKYFSPSFFGGDVNQAIEHYLRAIDLFERHKRTDEWLYLGALAFLGKSYMRVGEVEKAVVIYQKALIVEPDFGWVKNSLLPKAKASLVKSN